MVFNLVTQIDLFLQKCKKNPSESLIRYQNPVCTSKHFLCSDYNSNSLIWSFSNAFFFIASYRNLVATKDPNSEAVKSSYKPISAKMERAMISCLLHKHIWGKADRLIIAYMWYSEPDKIRIEPRKCHSTFLPIESILVLTTLLFRGMTVLKLSPRVPLGMLFDPCIIWRKAYSCERNI